MNTYEFDLNLNCPENGAEISYVLKIRSTRKILVEDLQAFAATFQSCHHEALADAFFNQFGGYQVIRAIHHGVRITSKRGRK